MLHFSIGPKSANFTTGYIKSKHAMVVLNLLLQYNNEVNSNQTPTNFSPQTKKCKQENNSAYTRTALKSCQKGLTFNDQEILKQQ